MADNTPKFDTVETLKAKLIQQCAGHIEVPAFIADVDALIAAVRAEQIADLWQELHQESERITQHLRVIRDGGVSPFTSDYWVGARRAIDAVIERLPVVYALPDRAEVDALIAAVRAENETETPNDVCQCGDYRHEHENGTGHCLTCAKAGNTQPFPICEQFRPAAVRAEERHCCVCDQRVISGGYVCDVCFAARS